MMRTAFTNKNSIFSKLNNERSAVLNNGQSLNGVVYLHIVGRMMTASVRLGV